MKRKTPTRTSGPSRGTTLISLSTKRAIFLQGEIDDNLFCSLTPQILRLKEESSRPITVFIDSRGGSPGHANRILGLLRTVDDRGEKPQIITVATGYACSAAADFLAQGDYVMAYREACLLFHGTRHFTEEPITREEAKRMEFGLEWQNSRAARRLALSVFERFLRLYMHYADQVTESRETRRAFMAEYDDLIGKGQIDLPALVWVLSNKVEGDANSLFITALEEVRRIRRILHLYKEFFVENKVDSVILELVASRIKGERKQARMQLRVLESVIASRVAEDEDWDLRRKSFQDLEADFRQAVELAKGDIQNDFADLLLKYEDIFFSDKDLAKVRQMRTAMTVEQFDANNVARAQFDAAVGRAYRKAEPLWQYVSTLCRLLNEGENEVEPGDAWHLGLIDEVIGTPLAHRQRAPKEEEGIKRQLSVADRVKFETFD